MPRVPYDPAATVTPEASGEHLNVNAPAAAFGVNIAQAIEGFGAEGEKVGDELWARAHALQDLQNEKDARDAATSYMASIAQKASDFETLEGQAAKDQLPGFLKDLDQSRISGRSNLKTLNAQRMYDADTSAIQRNVTMLAARHAATQFKFGLLASNKASIDLDAQTWTNPRDESEYDQKLARVKEKIDSISDIQNYTREQHDDLQLHTVSRLRSEQIGALAKSGDITTALAILDEHKADLTQDDFKSVSGVVFGQNRVVGASSLVQSIYDPDKTYKEMEAEVREQSPKYAHGDPLFEQDAIKALQLRDNQTKFTLQRDRQNNLQTVEGAFRDADSMQQLLADPEVAKAYHSLPAKDQNSIPGKLLSAKKQYNEAESYSNFVRLKGMSQSNPEQFLETDLFNTPLSVDDRQKLLDIRAKQMKNPGDDLRVTRAMSLLRSSRAGQMQALGIYRRDSNDPDSYDHFVGALQEALEIWQQDHKNRPSDQEIIDAIGPAVLRTQPKGWFFKTDQLIAKDFERPTSVPTEFRQKAVDEVVKKGLPVPTDRQILEAYTREQFTKLYGGTAKMESDSARPTVPQSK